MFAAETNPSSLRPSLEPLGLISGFPGPAQVRDAAFAQVIDGRLLGQASLWAANDNAAAGEAVQRAVAAHPEASHSVAELAGRAGIR
ncbi:hypothetical protein [Lichenicoccus sp.]|uniref:hypothetical protein n=1 Tax=Lichenicoccus sp. TaxID=2781899 RepID=UPI003D0D4F18